MHLKKASCTTNVIMSDKDDPEIVFINFFRLLYLKFSVNNTFSERKT